MYVIRFELNVDDCLFKSSVFKLRSCTFIRLVNGDYLNYFLPFSLLDSYISYIRVFFHEAVTQRITIFKLKLYTCIRSRII